MAKPDKVAEVGDTVKVEERRPGCEPREEERQIPNNSTAFAKAVLGKKAGDVTTVNPGGRYMPYQVKILEIEPRSL